MSVDDYTRLEQGRDHNHSDAVLGAVARTLRPDADEREHLFALGRPVVAREPPAADSPSSEVVHPGILALIDSLDTVPAMLLGRRMDVLAWNPPRRPRHVRLRLAAEGFAHLRVISARHPGNVSVQTLVGELAVTSEEFRILWARLDVHEKSLGAKLLRGGGGSVLRISFETLQVASAAASSGEEYLVTSSAADEAARAAFAGR